MKINTYWGVELSSVTVDPEAGLLGYNEEEEKHYSSLTGLHGAGTIDLKKYPRAIQFGAYHPWRPEVQTSGPEVLPGVHVFVPQLRASNKDGEWVSGEGIAVPCEMIEGVKDRLKPRPRYPTVIRWVNEDDVHILFVHNTRAAISVLKEWAKYEPGHGMDWRDMEVDYLSPDGEEKKHPWKFFRDRDYYQSWWLGGVNCEAFLPGLVDERIIARDAFPGNFLFGEEGPWFFEHMMKERWAYYNWGLIRKILTEDPRTTKGHLADGWHCNGAGWAYKRFPKHVLWCHRAFGKYELSPLVDPADAPVVINRRLGMYHPSESYGWADAWRRYMARVGDVHPDIAAEFTKWTEENSVSPPETTEEALNILGRWRREFPNKGLRRFYETPHFTIVMCDELIEGQSPVLCLGQYNGVGKPKPTIHAYKECPEDQLEGKQLPEALENVHKGHLEALTEYMGELGMLELVPESIPGGKLTEAFLKDFRETTDPDMKMFRGGVDWPFYYSEKHFSWDACNALKKGESPVLCLKGETPSVHLYKECSH